ncbi:MAG: tetratricopeptide repeat protein [Candidatus Aminicenantia bacterium]
MNKFKKALSLFFSLIIIFLISSSLLFSQAGRGIARINGKVVDESGNPVALAKIILQFLQNEEITRETTTDKKGKWLIVGLGSGQWKIIVSVQGFMPYQKTINVSQLERNPSLNIVLKKVEKPVVEGAEEIELFEKANQLFEEKKFDEAITYYREFLSINPEFYQIHFNLGNCYKEKGEVEQALKEYQIIIEKANQGKDRKIRAKTLAAIGECYLIKEDLNSAQNYFKQSLELNPKDEILAYNVGEIYFAHQKLNEAIEYFKLAAQIKSDWSDSYLKLGYVYLNKADYMKAKENFNKFLELESDSERSASVKNIIDYLEKMNKK